MIAQLLPLLGAEGAHALLHFSAIKPSDVASASCELAAGRDARTQLHQLLRSEPSLKPLEATTQVGEGVDTSSIGVSELTRTDLAHCPLAHLSGAGEHRPRSRPSHPALRWAGPWRGGRLSRGQGQGPGPGGRLPTS